MSLTRVESISKTNSFLRNIYLWMVMALSISAGVALMVANSTSIQRLIFGSKFGFFAIIIAQVAVALFLSFRIYKLSFSTAFLLFISYAVLTGVTLSTIFLVYAPTVILKSFVSAAAAFLSMAIFATFTKKDLSVYKPILFGALIGLIVATLINMFMKSNSLDLIISYVGVLIFMGLTAFDVQKLILISNKEDLATDNIAVLGAFTLYLDFINLFLYLLRIFGRRD